MASSERRRRGPPRLPPGTDPLDYLLSQPTEIREEMVRALGIEQADGFDREWPKWAHEGQVPEEGDWSTCVVMGGRSFGKTRAGSEWIVSLLKGPDGTSPRNPLRIALVGATLAEARSVMVEGRSGLMAVAGPWIRAWRPSLGLIRFRTGAEAQLFSGHSPELLRGPEHDYAWCDELAKWEKAQECWDMLQLGLRVGTRPRALVTTTPRAGPVLRRIIGEPGTILMGGASDSNPHNSPAWIRSMRARYAGTRLERQELDGELLADNPGALWSEELLTSCRSFDTASRLRSTPAQDERNVDAGLPPTAHPEEPVSLSNWRLEGPATFTRIVIAVDPPSGAGTCGIVACAKDAEGRAHVLADHSVTGRSPEGWARAVADAARVHSYPPRDGAGDPPQPEAKAGGGAPPPPPPEPARPPVWVMCPRTGTYVLEQPAPLPSAGEGDSRASAPERGEGALPILVVAESNQGGLMVRSVLRIADPSLRVKLVTATQGKSDRASPVAMLFEAGKVVLHGRFPALEAQLCGMIAGGGYEGPGTSPDRAEAMVWALTELMLAPQRAVPRIRTL